jgi:hypothetical protein
MANKGLPREGRLSGSACGAPLGPFDSFIIYLETSVAAGAATM